jgi:hypothetical protein
MVTLFFLLNSIFSLHYDESLLVSLLLNDRTFISPTSSPSLTKIFYWLSILSKRMWIAHKVNYSGKLNAKLVRYSKCLKQLKLGFFQSDHALLWMPSKLDPIMKKYMVFTLNWSSLVAIWKPGQFWITIWKLDRL